MTRLDTDVWHREESRVVLKLTSLKRQPLKSRLESGRGLAGPRGVRPAARTMHVVKWQTP